MNMGDVRELGDDQWKWLNRFKSIHLDEWRLIVVGSDVTWMYVGRWEPRIGDGYTERSENLRMNRYFYWPAI